MLWLGGSVFLGTLVSISLLGGMIKKGMLIVGSSLYVSNFWEEIRYIGIFFILVGKVFYNM